MDLVFQEQLELALRNSRLSAAQESNDPTGDGAAVKPMYDRTAKPYGGLAAEAASATTSSSQPHVPDRTTKPSLGLYSSQDTVSEISFRFLF